MDRFFIPNEVKEVLDTAIEQNVLDVHDVYALALQHKDNWSELVQDVVHTAFTWIHVNKAKHEAVVIAANKFWKVQHNV